MATKINTGNRRTKNNVHKPYMYTTGPNIQTSILRLFMYATEESLFKILQTGKLRLSLPWNTNDVTECVAQKAYEQSEGVKGYGYLCFSANPHSPAMWGQYADRSKGACLAFDFEVSKEEHTPLPTYRILDKGTYFENGNTFKLRAIEYKTNRLQPVTKQEEPYALEFFARKSKEWEHEKEYRLLYRLDDSTSVSSGREKGAKMPRFYVDGLLSHLSAIILGTRFPHEIAEVRAQMQEFSSDAEKKGIHLAYSPHNIRIMNVEFDDRSFAFKSEINFKPSINITINDERIMHLQISSDWTNEIDENYEDIFQSMTYLEYDVKNIYLNQYNEDEIYYIAKSKGNEGTISIFRKNKEGKLGIVSVIHPDLLQIIYDKAVEHAATRKKHNKFTVTRLAINAAKMR